MRKKNGKKASETPQDLRDQIEAARDKLDQLDRQLIAVIKSTRKKGKLSRWISNWFSKPDDSSLKPKKRDVSPKTRGGRRTSKK